jgi:imidazolonepropionase-like amidohydrolase
MSSLTAQGYRITGKVIDGTGAPAIDDGAVVVVGDRIEWVGDRASLPQHLAVPELEAIDLPGHTVMPGIVDAHVHTSFGEARSEEELALYTPVAYRSMLAAWNAKKVLRAGVTSACDPASTFNIAASLRDAIEAGIVEGPRLAAAGAQITTHQGLEDAFPSWMEFPVGQAGVLVKSRDEIIEAVRLQVKDGVDIVKVSGSNDSAVTQGPVEGMAFTEEEFRILADEVHRLGRKCTVHARTAASVRATAAAGFDWLMHASYMDRQGLDLVLEKQIPIVPTLTLLVNILDSASGESGASSIDVFKREVDAAAENLSRAHKEGATLICGSESGWSLVPYGEWHARELEIFVTHLGLTPLEAIHAATGAAAVTVPRWADQIGTLTPGKFADVLVVDGDPLADIRILQSASRRKMVLKGGVPVDLDTPLPERHEYSWERNKIYLLGRFRYDETTGRGHTVS